MWALANLPQARLRLFDRMTNCADKVANSSTRIILSSCNDLAPRNASSKSSARHSSFPTARAGCPARILLRVSRMADDPFARQANTLRMAARRPRHARFLEQLVEADASLAFHFLDGHGNFSREQTTMDDARRGAHPPANIIKHSWRYSRASILRLEPAKLSALSTRHHPGDVSLPRLHFEGCGANGRSPTRHCCNCVPRICDAGATGLRCDQVRPSCTRSAS